MTDVLEALVALVAADSSIREFVGSVEPRVFGDELPQEETESMPRAVVVLKQSGGPGNPGTVGLTRARIDAFAYGESPYEASQLRIALYAVLQAIDRNVSADVLLHAATEIGGPIPLKDPDGRWPVVVETWLVTASTVAVA